MTPPEMNSKLKRRIMAFYIGGVLNGLLGFYVLVNGASFLPAGTVRTLVIIFFLFAAVDFYFPHAIKKKWLAENARNRAQNVGTSPPT